jgi:hypothetical protein
MDPDRRQALLKTAQLSLALIFTFTLGRFSQFIGVWGRFEWTGIVLHVGIVAVLVHLLVRSFWKGVA